MQVSAVGDNTEHGNVFRASQIDNSVKTPLMLQLERLGSMIARISYVIAAIIIIGRMGIYFSDFNGNWLDALQYGLNTFMLAVALLVVSVPEGLPMAVTLSLAFSMRRMLKTNNLVRRLHACETMGATTVICTDKTGTLTQNQMRVADMDVFGDVPSEILHAAIAANSTAQLDRKDPERPSVLGNPTEGALLLHLDKTGIDYEKIRASYDIEAELPFTTGRKYMATVVRDASGRRILLVKGAPEIVYDMCGNIPEDAPRMHIEGLLARYQEQAMRTLGFAYAIIGADEPCPIYDDTVHCSHLTFIAVAAIADPVRADVPEAIREVIGAGVAIKIVTGDTPRTAREIARQVGLWNDDTDTLETAAITGVEFEALSDEELRRRLPAIKVIARARPMETLGGDPARYGRSGGRHRRWNQRCPGTESRTSRLGHGRRNSRSQGGRRHYDTGQLVCVNRSRNYVGPLAIPQHPAIHTVPNYSQRHRMPRGILRRTLRTPVSANSNSDALGQFGHGYLCRYGSGFSAPVTGCHALQATTRLRLHNLPFDVAIYHRYGCGIFRHTHRDIPIPRIP